VGVNTHIVQEGVNGFVCDTPNDWQTALEKLLQSHELRTQLGQAARQTIEQRYSVVSNQNNFKLFFS
jgi:glycosyltransferase involved in cell wall biosynthesis